MQSGQFFPSMDKSATLALTRRVVNHLASGVGGEWHHRRMPDLEGKSHDLPRMTLPSGEAIPVLGQGTWHMAEDQSQRSDEIKSLRLGIDLGMTLIDTAEMYANGAAETLVGEAIRGRRDEVFLVGKVLPQHAARRDTRRACERSLKRLGTDRIDLYLLHWRGGVPLKQTLEGFRALQDSGLIRNWGVSNFDLDDMQELVGLPSGSETSTNQVLYNLVRRGVEYDLLPWCRERGLPIMAYSPIEQGRLNNHALLAAIASRHGATPAQVALAWVLHQPGVIAIPKAAHPEHVEANRRALELRLRPEELAQLDQEFPPPSGPEPLAML
jgi:diketogulonate reductase-like aldo/keto reductase